jgi:hypothetical protein
MSQCKTIDDIRTTQNLFNEKCIVAKNLLLGNNSNQQNILDDFLKIMITEIVNETIDEKKTEKELESINDFQNIFDENFLNADL